MITIRYKTRRGGSGMMNIASRAACAQALERFARYRLEAHAEENSRVIGEAWRGETGWTWYCETEKVQVSP